jgi:hypothetical protein
MNSSASITEVPAGTHSRAVPEGSARAAGVHPSPPLTFLAGIHVALFVAGVAVPAILADGAVFPSPYDNARAVRYFAEHSDAVRVGSLLLFGSAVPLGLFGASVVSRLRFLGVRAAGVWIGLFGGLGAALMLSLSGLVIWTLSQAGVADVASTVTLLHWLAFATGGPGFTVLFGLFVAGVSLSGGLTQHLPRWLMWFGLAIAAVGELSVLTLIAPVASLSIPLTRFPGLVWLLCVGALLPRRLNKGGRDRASNAVAGAR